MKISKHFEDWELLSPEIIKLCNEKDIPTKWFIPQKAIDVLEDLREELNAPVYINQPKKNLYRRGICTNQENLEAKRTLTSQHNYCAFDVSIYSIEIEELYRWFLQNAKTLGIGAFGVNREQNFVHFDFRNADCIEIKY